MTTCLLFSLAAKIVTWKLKIGLWLDYTSMAACTSVQPEMVADGETCSSAAANLENTG